MKSRKRILYLLFLSFFITSSFAQSNIIPIEHPIYLADSINKPNYEFSGIARWKNYILLVPQHTSSLDKYHIVCIDTASIDSVITGKALFATKTTKLIFSNSLDTIYKAIKKSILPHTDFGGFEAAVVVNDNIFLTVETDSLCYVVKGAIDAQTMQVNFAPNDTLSLPKPDYTFGNAGFESVTYLAQQKRLLALYENNAITSAPTAFSFDVNLKNRQPVLFVKPLLFRVTDVASLGGNNIIALNHYYRDYNDTITCGIIPKGAATLKNEYCYYVGDKQREATMEMGANPQQTNFTRLIELTIENSIIHWKKKKLISYSSDNWEGILPYKKGVLMVVDGRPPGVPCKLSYFAWRE
jgi:hypothetical protein